MLRKLSRCKKIWNKYQCDNQNEENLIFFIELTVSYVILVTPSFILGIYNFKNKIVIPSLNILHVFSTNFYCVS